jgi:hypothetical protein
MRCLGYGSASADLEKTINWFRAYRSLVQAYDSEKNRGQPAQSFKAEFHLGACKTENITDLEIQELETQIPGSGNLTDAIKTAKEHVELAVSLILVNSLYESTESTLLLTSQPGS